MNRGVHLNVPTGSQHLRSIHIPKSMMSAPFLQHPALTAGQRRYLYSIANVYSMEHQYGEKSSITEDAEKDVHTRTKPQGQRKDSSSSSVAQCDVILPKISNSPVAVGG
uniref:Uncharacterized protein n=1 Tax=Cynoglossus semilaevis TaxID=244447 RepID=A0A3P8VRC6_CYNSE